MLAQANMLRADAKQLANSPPEGLGKTYFLLSLTINTTDFNTTFLDTKVFIFLVKWKDMD